jgi:hypothetical protein
MESFITGSFNSPSDEQRRLPVPAKSSSYQKKDRIQTRFSWSNPHGAELPAMGEGESPEGGAGADFVGIGPAADLV